MKEIIYFTNHKQAFIKTPGGELHSINKNIFAHYIQHYTLTTKYIHKDAIRFTITPKNQKT